MQKKRAWLADPFQGLCRIAAMLSVGIIAWIVGDISFKAWPALHVYGTSLLGSTDWNPYAGHYGIFGYLLGTLVSSFIAMAIALPLGLIIAVYLTEDFLPASWRQAFRFLIELLAAIPSVVYGLWGIAVVIPAVQYLGDISYMLRAESDADPVGPVYGNCLLSASLVLALMILPTITAISRGALQAVPTGLRLSGYAIGYTRWETIGSILLPAAAPGILASAVLAFSRAMGETMAVAMLIGNSPHFTWSVFAPAGTLASLLANQFPEANGMVVSALMAAALVLIVVTVVVNTIGDWILRVSQRRMKGLR